MLFRSTRLTAKRSSSAPSLRLLLAQQPTYAQPRQKRLRLVRTNPSRTTFSPVPIGLLKRARRVGGARARLWLRRPRSRLPGSDDPVRPFTIDEHKAYIYELAQNLSVLRSRNRAQRPRPPRTPLRPTFSTRPPRPSNPHRPIFRPAPRSRYRSSFRPECLSHYRPSLRLGSARPSWGSGRNTAPGPPSCVAPFSLTLRDKLLDSST